MNNNNKTNSNSNSNPKPIPIVQTSTTTTTNINTINKSQIIPLTPPLALHQTTLAHLQLLDVSTSPSTRCRTSSISSKPITANGVHHVLQSGEDSSQSSLNLSASSGYLSGSSANSSGNSNLNISVGNGTTLTASNVFNGQIGQNATITMNGVSVELGNGHHPAQVLVNGGQTAPLPIQPQQTNSRRRTISSNSNG